jgi:hypothetical protein
MTDEVKIDTIREAVKVFEDTLAHAIKTLEQQDMVGLERLRTLDQYKLVHPRGVIGLLYGGSNYESITKGRTLLMKRTILVTIAPMIRFIDNSMQPSEKYQTMMPAEYVDFIVNNLSGITIFNHLPENERKVYPIRDELFKEEDYVWTYLVTMGIPVDFIEKPRLTGQDC